MAKEKTATTPKAAAGKKKAIASKKNLNLAFHESSIHLKTLIPTILIIVIAALAFLKFGFMDQLDKKTAAYAEFSEKQTQLAVVNAKLTGYDELAEKYGRYSYGWMTDAEASLVNRMDVLDILERIVTPVSYIEDFALNNNVISCNISGITLDQTSALVNELEADPQIKSVSVSRAKNDDASMDAQVALTIILEKEAEVDE